MRSLVAYWKQRHRESRKRVAGWRARRGVQGARDLSLSQKRVGRKARARKNTGKRNEAWTTVDEGILEGSTEAVEKKKREEKKEKKKERKKCTAAGKSQTRAHTLALPNSRIRIGGRECRAIFQWLRPSLNSR